MLRIIAQGESICQGQALALLSLPYKGLHPSESPATQNGKLNIIWTISKILKNVFLLMIFAWCQIGFATKYAGDFEELGVSARALGLGGAYVAVANDASAIYYNPASTIRTQSYNILLMHAQSFGGLVTNNYLGLIHSNQRNSAGLGILHNSIPNIKLTTLPDTTQPPSDTNRPILDRKVNANHLVFISILDRNFQIRFRLGLKPR